MSQPVTLTSDEDTRVPGKGTAGNEEWGLPGQFGFWK